jgi:serine/threonine-protein kinase
VTSVVEPGRRCLGDRYELHQLIAAGGMGQVWRGTDVALHRSVAIKVLRSEYTGDPSFLDRFRAEAQHAASLSHPNIAAVFDYGEEIAQDGTGETMAYLVMELVEGEPLSALVAREGPLDTATTLSLLRQTAFGLGEAHRAGMVHRDVKPGNILVRPDGTVKITDFGIAWSARSVALTRTGQVIGTPQYLSPEQAEGRLASPASDVYALGLIGYECLTGHPAFEGDNAVTIALKQVRQDPEPLPGELPADVRQLIGRALVKDPAGRLPDGAAFAAAIDDILAGRPLPAAPPTVAVPAAAHSVVRPPAARRRSRAAMVLLPVLGLLAGAGIAVALLLALSNHDRPGSPTEAAQQRETGSLVLDAQDYVGRQVDDVAARLTGLGLQVQLKSEVRDDVVPDQVTGIDPAGRPLEAGDTVVVTYAVANAQDGAKRNSAGVTGAAVGAGNSSVSEVGTVPDGAAAATSGGGSDATPTDLPATQTESPAPESSTPTESSPTETATSTETAPPPASSSSPPAP